MRSVRHTSVTLSVPHPLGAESVCCSCTGSIAPIESLTKNKGSCTGGGEKSIAGSLLIPFTCPRGYRARLASFKQKGKRGGTPASPNQTPTFFFLAKTSTVRPIGAPRDKQHTSRTLGASTRGSRRKYQEIVSPSCAQVPSPEKHRVAPCHVWFDVFVSRGRWE